MIVWNNDGWTTLQDADAEKHILGITCRAENGKVVEVRIRHNDGEEIVAKVKLGGQPALPMDIKTFEKLFNKGELEMN